jgi:SHQ1 protein
MTITPSFLLRQNESHIFLEISVPHIRISVEEIQLTLTDRNRQLHWYAPPIYLLVLNFAPYQFRSIEEEDDDLVAVGEDQQETATTNSACHASYLPHIDNGVIRIELEKRIPQQHWENLDLLGQWKPPKTAIPKWLQGVVAHDEETEGESSQRKEVDDVIHHSHHPLVSPSGGFGFDRMFRENLFRDLTRDGLGKEMLECPWPLTVADDDDLEQRSIQSRRRMQRIEEYENRLFSAERYQQDLYIEDDCIYQSALAMQPHWNQAPVAEEPFFSPSERHWLATIPYPLLDPPVTLPSTVAESSRHQRLCLGLLDILFAYVYDHITTDGDPTVESAWTVFILSTSFSWCDDWLDDASEEEDVFQLIPSVVCSSTRRALIYPYIRSLAFAGFIWQHVETLLRRGVRTILRCLLQVRTVLDRSELYYFGNKLYVDPYLIWLQQYPSTQYLETTILVPMADRIAYCLGPSDQLLRMKESLGLNLPEIEADVWADESSDVVEGPNPNEGRDASSSGGDTTSDDDHDDDDDDSGPAATEVEDTLEGTINGIISTIPEEREINDEDKIADDLSGDLRRLHIDGDHHPFDIFRESKTDIQTPHFETNHSSTKRTPLIQEVD